ncbi:hypothetical protein HDU79_011592 [Rhizoclosmatium sp. JEL0117]|nr:hypothetical protein HDU79_011592 [Rhizoclosmatium sp. JEL0117]
MLTVQHLHRHYETVIQGITLDFVRARKEADDCVKQFEQEAQLVSDRNENAIKELYAIIKNQQQLMESMREDLHLTQTTSVAYKDLVVKQEGAVNEVERLHDILATKTLELKQVSFDYWNFMPVAIPLPVATAFIKDLFTGLEYIHDVLGMCHRDIKPGNALVSVSKAILVISDFDTADFCPPTNPTTSGFFDFCGTVGYMAPEVAAFDPNFETPETSSYGTSCDIFSAGSMVREICGKIPEETDAAEGHAEIELRVMGMECCAYHPQQRPTAQSVLMVGLSFNVSVNV